MSVVDALLKEEPVRLDDSGYLALLHRFFKLSEGLFADQLFRTALIDPTDQKPFERTLRVSGKPPLALAPAVAQSLGRLSEVATLARLEKPEHLRPVE